MGVNGVEIAVGQRWRNTQGREVTIVEHLPGLINCWRDRDGFVYDDQGSCGSWANDGRLNLDALVAQPLAGDTHQSTTFGPGGIAEQIVDQFREIGPALEKHRQNVAAREAAENRAGIAINPKDAIGSTKLPLHLWPAEATAVGCIGMLEGMLKYGRNNFIAGQGVIASIYVDALFRHVTAWFEGEELTHDTNTDHLGNALACLAIIVKARAHGRLIDDRNFATLPDGARYRALIEQITPHVKRLQQMFADKAPRHFTIGDIPAVERKKADDTEGGAA